MIPDFNEKFLSLDEEEKLKYFGVMPVNGLVVDMLSKVEKVQKLVDDVHPDTPIANLRSYILIWEVVFNISKSDWWDICSA